MSWAFPIEIDETTGRIKTVSEEAEIRQSLLLLLKTIRGERQMQPLYGSQLNRFVFEPVSYELLREIQEEVLKTIYYWEKRIEKVDVEVLQNIEDTTQLLIRINYQIKKNGDWDTFDYHYPLSI